MATADGPGMPGLPSSANTDVGQFRHASFRSASAS